MKNVLLVSFISVIFQLSLFAQPVTQIENVNHEEINYEERDNDKTRSLFIWIPGIFTKGASLFINKDEEPELKHTLRFLGGLKIRILNGDTNSAKWKRKTTRWERRIKRKKLDDLMVIKNEDNVVHMKAGVPGNGKIKNYAFLINADDTAVLLLGKSKLDLKKLMKLVNKVSSE